LTYLEYRVFRLIILADTLPDCCHLEIGECYWCARSRNPTVIVSTYN
jgi:hypothetical protein